MPGVFDMMECPTYTATIFIAGPIGVARGVCQRFVMERSICVTIEPTTYVYPGCAEEGVRVGLINYARFPTTPESIFTTALDLARELREAMHQYSFSIVASDRTVFDTIRRD